MCQKVFCDFFKNIFTNCCKDDFPLEPTNEVSEKKEISYSSPLRVEIEERAKIPSIISNVEIHPIDLVVLYSKKEHAKALGARWNSETQKWYAPNETYSTLLSEFPRYEEVKFVGENRTFGGNVLNVDMIPKSCAFKNVRSNVREETWERIRYTVRDRSKNVCELCGISARQGIQSTGNHCHERFSYDQNTKVQKLERLMCICEECHNSTHFGRSNIEGNFEKAREHLKAVRKWTEEEVDRNIEDAYKILNARENIQWTLDLSVLTNSGIALKE
jgi:5-methylcytosine-specific restriction endonuclease McrA